MFEKMTRRLFFKTVSAPVIISVAGIEIKVAEKSLDPEQPTIIAAKQLMPPGNYTFKILEIRFKESQVRKSSVNIAFTLQEKNDGYMHSHWASIDAPGFLFKFLDKFNVVDRTERLETLMLDDWIGREAELTIEKGPEYLGRETRRVKL